MVMVTERAKAYLKESVLGKIQAKVRGASARLAQTGAAALGVFPDQEMEGDQVVVHEGVTVLLIDNKLSSRLTGAMIDCVTAPGESHLRIVPRSSR